MRNCGLVQTKITDSPSELAALLDDASAEIMSLDELDKGHMLISYVHKKEWVEENEASNIVISLWTTSWFLLPQAKSFFSLKAWPGFIS